MVKRLLYTLFLLLLICSCVDQPKKQGQLDVGKTSKSSDIKVKYAKGFQIQSTQTGYIINVKNPWPGAEDTYQYHLRFSGRNLVPEPDVSQPIEIPINRLILTSTTQIPPLVMLNESASLIGFPTTDYISSPAIRQLIEAGKVEELGANESINVERSISLHPDLVMGFGIDGNNPTYDQLQRAGIPVLYNGDWTESHPLGKAEWIKVFGVLLGKEKEAQQIFDRIERDYLNTLKKVENLNQPKVLVGASWKEIWYLPYGNSWQGKILKDAGGSYVYAQTKGQGSLAYNIERVLTDASKADFWIAPGQYTSYSSMIQDQPAYAQFQAFQEKKIYTFALNKGARGGITYYEEAHMKPDVVLKDLVKILHPELDLDHQLYFFHPLEP
ncbi:ABC transporter substrate-binding protein [Nonlabens xiamenensis]|uniref:ABC transporter substrate-binding protein n=1 Tax=Nonlabens xiamenensis TaxID=2341043 RepID=UPI000F6061F9|nr:ABC transporter substrate-binding protein [Nonlabens xiamenensis]